VELGLQSANFQTLKRVNRAHGISDFIDAVLRAKSRPLKVCAHVIIGLPGEDRVDFLETAKLIASLPVDGVKIHPLHVIRGTPPLALEYERGGFRVLSLEEYVRACAEVLEIIPEDVVVHRITGEVEERLLLAPDYCLPSRKSRVIEAVVSELERRGSAQGRKTRLFLRRVHAHQ